jgi:CRP-like cAMP-binding protein
MASERLRNKMLASLSRSDVELFRPEDVAFSRGDVLFNRGGQVNSLCFPHTALVSLVTDLSDGATIESSTIGSEGVVGAFAVNGNSIALNRSVIQLPGWCGMVPLYRAKKAFEKSERIRVLLGYFQQAFDAQLLQQVACNAAHDARSRCARCILTSLDQTEGDEIPLTHEFLGEMLGTTRPTVSVAVKELERAGSIATRYGRIRVLDRTRLEHASCECYGVIRDTYKRLLPRPAKHNQTGGEVCELAVFRETSGS